ncbi:DUF4167 domain-containing protein [Rhodopseudomonas sp. B29]|uniref:DUF4167 domain-containing protein n=1 Tax=Rhodopseudomonas sp. B29 TaxID=95607 RepID=UPI00034CD9C5|nr:DUF4167 domain-containing protein [Rhodopseudomonas sp. B29]
MRNGQNNKRLRNRNNGGNNNNNNRRGQNPMTRVFESNGPDIKIRGTASHIAEKYVQLARDARSSGDPVAAENYYQHAEHYFRLIAAAQEQFRQNQPMPRIDNDMLDGDDDSEGDYSNFGAEPGLVPQPQAQPYQQREQPQFQPRERDHQPREQRDRDQPRGDREQPQPREHRPQPQFQPREQPQPVVEGVDRLPSFITGPQPQISPAAFEGTGGAERFPRRRRRPHPRSEGAAAAAAAPAEDAAPGNE